MQTSVGNEDMSQPETRLNEFKVFNDSIHGHIEMHPLCTAIIDTPQFQRLRYVHQLGGTMFVFPGATHSRFEHSIGVYHLAGELARILQRRQPELNITDKDVLCVQVAGLCHDLGHGPYSHLFDGKFLPAIHLHANYTHEDISIKMLRHLIEDNNLWPTLKKYDITDLDLVFIMELMSGSQEEGISEWPYKGRSQDKSFLYEIVSNKKNGVDVDKWDYFARDCHHLGMRNNFDHTRFMKFARVISVDGQREICSRDKEVHNLYGLFAARHLLHLKAYQHKTALIIEHMIVEALLKADDYLLIEGTDGKMLKMSECPDDMVAFSKLTDAIFQQILFSTDPRLDDAKAILRRIERRDLYRIIGHSAPQAHTGTLRHTRDKQWREEIASMQTNSRLLQPDDFHIQEINLNYGMKDKNPIDRIHFYKKDNPNEAFFFRKEQVSLMLPEVFCEQVELIFCRRTDAISLAVAANSVQSWLHWRQTQES